MWQYQRTGESRKRKPKRKYIQEFMYRNTTNAEHEMYDYTRHNWGHRKGNKRLKEKSESHNRKTFNRELQKTAILGTAHVIPEVLQSQIRSLGGGNHGWFERRSTRKKKPVTRNKKKNNNV